MLTFQNLINDSILFIRIIKNLLIGKADQQKHKSYLF